MTLMQSPGACAPSPMLRTEAVAVRYGSGALALKPTTLAFARGEIVVLLGASGAGKSTLLRTLNGLVPATQGRVFAADIGDISGRAALRRHRRSTGMIFQQHHLIGRLSVLANVLMGRLGFHSTLASLAGWPRAEQERALSVIERVGLLPFALQRADQLSGGQQQRVGVARALVQQPTLLLADEPVASLDPVTAENLLALIHGICRSDGLTAVVSLHQLDLARRFSDRIIGMRQGEVVFDGSPAQLTDDIAARIYQGTPPPAAESPAIPFPILPATGATV